MKVGDLVKLKDVSEVTDVHPQTPSGSVGLIMEWNSEGTNSAFEGSDGFVLWNGRRDWDIEYEEDLELVNESR